jgi:hypothetical protein
MLGMITVYTHGQNTEVYIKLSLKHLNVQLLLYIIYNFSLYRTKTKKFVSTTQTKHLTLLMQIIVFYFEKCKKSKHIIAG